MLWKVLHYWVNVILDACFTLRGHLQWFLFLVGRICPLMKKHFLWPRLKRKAFYYGWVIFLQSAFWIWITKRFCLVRESAMFYHAGPISLVFFAIQFNSLQDVKLSRIVIYRSKAIRMKCSLKWSCVNYGELHCDSIYSSLVFFYSFDWSGYFLPW